MELVGYATRSRATQKMKGLPLGEALITMQYPNLAYLQYAYDTRRRFVAGDPGLFKMQRRSRQFARNSACAASHQSPRGHVRVVEPAGTSRKVKRRGGYRTQLDEPAPR
ncbi:hypothetical protein PSP6_690084 [Paraburkholderia tropica]|nr:hypothetical protein PSP6_690084 [Paraburkholderia tropica]